MTTKFNDSRLVNGGIILLTSVAVTFAAGSVAAAGGSQTTGQYSENHDQNVDARGSQYNTESGVAGTETGSFTDSTGGQALEEEAFRGLDKDQDGTLSQDEAARGQMLKSSPNFQLADINNNHKISKAEFDAYLQTKYGGVQPATTATSRSTGQTGFDDMDADGDGSVSRSEFSAFIAPTNDQEMGAMEEQEPADPAHDDVPPSTQRQDKQPTTARGKAYIQNNSTIPSQAH